ncbi:UNVERIFIED_CONTAM: cobalt/nickel transport system permease protein [Acetivibrio alkalicellulosi]
MIGIDRCAYSSNISNIRAEIKFRYAVFPLLICLFYSSNILSILTITAMSLSSVFLGGFQLKTYLRQCLVPVTFLLWGVVAVIFGQVDSSDLGVLFSFKLFGGLYGINTTLLHRGMTLFLKAFACVSCLCFFSLNTPVNSFLTYLKKKRFSKLLIELMELMYRFIFVIGEEAKKIYIAQNSRLGYKDFTTSIKSLGELVTSVFIKAFIRVERVNASLEARGFSGDFDYIIEEENGSKLMNILTLSLSSLLITLGIFERLKL